MATFIYADGTSKFYATPTTMTKHVKLYTSSGIRYMLAHMQTLGNGYVIGEVYSTGELQIGTTGHLKKLETPIHGMIRELYEETGICVNASTLVPWVDDTGSTSKLKGKPCDHMYSIVITGEHDISTGSIQLLPNREDVETRVGGVVYCTNKSMLKRIVLNGNKRHMAHDSIVAVAILPLSWVMKIRNW